MSTCVPAHALLSALVRRVVVDGALPPESDFVALLRLGITQDEMLAAFAPHGSPLAERARALIVALKS